MQLKVAKEEPQKLDQEIAHTILAKEELQEMIINNQTLLLSKKKEKTKIQGWM
jgi:hypothetical protein